MHVAQQGQRDEPVRAHCDGLRQIGTFPYTHMDYICGAECVLREAGRSTGPHDRNSAGMDVFCARCGTRLGAREDLCLTYRGTECERGNDCESSN